MDLSTGPAGLGVAGADPLLLLPLRLETTFVDAATGPELWLRIFPDQVAIDSHDPTLTGAEWDAAYAYWAAMAGLRPVDIGPQQACWATLAARFGPRRAAYLAQHTEPPAYESWIALKSDGPIQTPLALPAPPAPSKPSNLRTTSWEMTPVARCLPERWFAILYTGGAPAISWQIDRPKQDLAVGLAPPPVGPADAPPSSPTDPMAWMFDFDLALAAGMAVKIPLTANQRKTGFDQVIVVGTTSLDPAAGQLEIRKLLEAQRFTAGCAFVPQGTPTKNSPDATAGYSRKDDNYLESFAAERQASLVAQPGCDGRCFAAALGLDPKAVAHLGHADGQDQQDAAHMAGALWPVTGGYFLPYIMGYRQAPLDDLRSFVTRHLRARGPVPAFRIGATPYGVLPVMTISQPIAPPAWSSLLAPAARFINAAASIWQNSVIHPAAGGADPGQVQTTILASDASICRVNAAWYFGPQLMWNLLQFVRAAGDPTLNAVADNYAWQIFAAQYFTAEQVKSLGWPAAGAPVDGLVMQKIYASNLPLVTPNGVVSETDVLPGTPNYLQFFASQTVTRLLAQGYPPASATLLFRLLWQAVLLEYAAVGGKLLKAPLADPEYFPFTATNPIPGTFLWALQMTQYPPQPGMAAGPTPALGDYLQSQAASSHPAQKFPTLVALFASLEALSQRPTAALQRAFTEVLDVWSYRLDAWWTALATATLAQARIAAPQGILVGSYGYVANLRPNTPQPPLTAAQLATATAAGLAGPDASPLPDPLAPRPGNSGFIFAPSLAQAATGAVLRNGYLAGLGAGSGAACAIDLSSARVRRALQLLEGMRQGQSLGALLGYQFESALAGGTLGYIPVFRDLYPIVANKLTGTPADNTAASNVVDGAALQQAWVGKTIPWGYTGLPAMNAADYGPLATALDLLNDSVDAVSDLGMAESVFQIVRGNPARAGGALDAISRDQRPPEPQAVETPRTGLGFTQRVLSLIRRDPNSPPPPAWGNGDANQASPRTLAEPGLEHWVSALLPDPAQVQFQVTYQLASASAPASQTVALAQLPLAALDLLALTPEADQDAKTHLLTGADLPDSELHRWILAQLSQLAGATGPIPAGAEQLNLAYDRNSTSAYPVTVPELLLLARSLKALIGTSRPLTAGDLLPTAGQTDVPAANLAEAAARVAAAQSALGALQTAFADALPLAGGATATPADLSKLLLAASRFGAPNAAPVALGDDAASAAALTAQARVVQSLLADRVAKAAADAAQAPSSGASLTALQAIAADIFGTTFLLLPTYTPAPGDSLSAGLADIDTAVNLWRGQPATARLPLARVVQQMTHVRPGVARVDEAINLSTLLAGLAGSAAFLPDFDVVQLPYDPHVPWFGAGAPPTQAAGDPSLEGKCALILWTPAPPAGAAATSLSGLFFDEWLEQIPNLTEKSAVTVNYQEPTARAPQTLLLAVPPPGTAAWSAQLLSATVLETMTYAQIRTVDPDSLQSLGQVLPGIYTAQNIGGLTVSAKLGDLSQPDPT